MEVASDSAVVREMRTLRRLVDAARHIGTVRPLVRYLHDAIDRDFPAEVQSRIACKAGCGWCCHTRLSASAPEIIHLAASTARSAPSSLAHRVREQAAARRKEPDLRAGKAMPACALLDAGHCRNHAARPVACRTAVSFDADRCRISTIDPLAEVIPTDLSTIALRTAYDIALQGALVHAGLSTTRYELATGLAAAFAEPGAETAWLEGERIFAYALVLDEEPFLDVPVKRAFYAAAFGSAAP
jgi:hypothetical protein